MGVERKTEKDVEVFDFKGLRKVLWVWAMQRIRSMDIRGKE